MEREVYYPKSFDIIYRSGYVLGFIGIAVFAYSYVFNEISIMWLAIPVFYSGTLISSVFLLVWKKEIKIFILGCVVSGIVLGIAYALHFRRDAEVLIISMGLVLAGLAGLYGKEAYCFHFREGWILMWSFPVIILSNIVVYSIGEGNNQTARLIFSAVYLILTFLALSFLIKKLRQPILHVCQG